MNRSSSATVAATLASDTPWWDPCHWKNLNTRMSFVLKSACVASHCQLELRPTRPTQNHQLTLHTNVTYRMQQTAGIQTSDERTKCCPQVWMQTNLTNCTNAIGSIVDHHNHAGLDRMTNAMMTKLPVNSTLERQCTKSTIENRLPPFTVEMNTSKAQTSNHNSAKTA